MDSSKHSSASYKVDKEKYDEEYERIYGKEEDKEEDNLITETNA